VRLKDIRLGNPKKIFSSEISTGNTSEISIGLASKSEILAVF